jgi:hypothetical protein
MRIQPHLRWDTEMNKGYGTDAKAESGTMEHYRRVIRYMRNTKSQPHVAARKAIRKTRKTIV